MPFTNYCSTFTVQEEDGRTRVIWSADFDPAAGAERSAAEFVARVCRGGLENARMLLEKAGWRATVTVAAKRALLSWLIVFGGNKHSPIDQRHVDRQ